MQAINRTCPFRTNTGVAGRGVEIDYKRKQPHAQSSFWRFLAVKQVIFLTRRRHLPAPGLSAFLTYALEAPGISPTLPLQALLYLHLFLIGTAIATTDCEQRRNRTGRGRCIEKNNKSSLHINNNKWLAKWYFLKQKI
jgi:hypothetical protein